DSEYRHEIESRVDPFKGLLLGLFFISVGMSVDIRLLAREPLLVVSILISLIALKGLILYAVARLAGEKRPTALKLAAILAQGGEFAFVIFTVAVQNRVLEPSLRDLLVVAITLSMALTPVLIGVFSRLAP